MSPRNDRPRVLVVDDEEDILISFEDMLTALMPDVEVLTAASPAKAREILRKGSVDLIISDYKMPGEDGLDFLEECRRDSPDVARILVTAYPDLDIAVRSINNARVDNFFTKPFQTEEVVTVVRETLSRRRAERMRQQAFARAMARRGGNQ